MNSICLSKPTTHHKAFPIQPASTRGWARGAAALLSVLATMLLATCVALEAKAAEARTAPKEDHASMQSAHAGAPSPLVEKVKAATTRYRDINVALNEGWVQATPCVSSPSAGAMGVHFLKADRLHDGVLKADEPEMLIYEPLPAGKFRLLGVEYLVLATDWSAHNPPGSAPSVDGHLANFVGEPNRYALPAFYEMHVWAWEDNPNGSFADFNSKVSCSMQAGAK